MQGYFCVAVLCIISGIISYMTQRKAYKSIKILAFYVFAYVGVLSMMKLLLHEGGLSVFESFEDSQPVTYVHYFVPMLFIAVLFPFIIKATLKEKAVKFMYMADSFFFFSAGIFFLAFGRISNLEYCVLMLVGIALSFLSCRLNREAVFIGKLRRDDVLLPLTVLSFWAMTNLVFSTGELYLNNVDEFPVLFESLMIYVILASLVYIALYTGGAYLLLTKKQYKLFFVCIFAIALMNYVQGLFLNWELAELEGFEQKWDMAPAVINSAIWIFIIAALALLFVRNDKILKLYRSACIYICFIQLFTLVYMAATVDFSKKNQYELTIDGMLELDNENNVIVFVLDWFDGQIFEWIEDEAPDFLEPLKDFTNYRNTTSRYAYTDHSVPYMLTGVQYNNEDTLKEWYANAYNDDSLLREIDRQGYEIGIYTLAPYIDKSVQDIIVNYCKDVERKCRFADSVTLMLRCGGYKNMPFIFKDRFKYSTEDIEALYVDGNKFMTNNDSWIYDDLINKRLTVSDKEGGRGVFRFMHFRGAHMPISMNEHFENLTGNAEYRREYTHENLLSQAKGSMGIVYEYLEQMKQLGVYENATIIITADHGQNVYMDNDYGKSLGFADRTSNPILLVKQKGVNGRESMTVTDAQTSHDEFAASVIKAMGGNHTRFGKAFDEIGLDEKRTRVFMYGRAGAFVNYYIRGNVRSIEAWSMD